MMEEEKEEVKEERCPPKASITEHVVVTHAVTLLWNSWFVQVHAVSSKEQMPIWKPSTIHPSCRT